MRIAATVIVLAAACGGMASAQDLAPRAYLVTPVGSSALTFSYSLNRGDLLFAGSVPITDASARVHVASATYFRSLAVFGRSANVTVAIPYGVGVFEGKLSGEQRDTKRSGMFDAIVRFSINVLGGPAMTLDELAHNRPRRTLGISLKVVAPSGQYDPTRLINLGSNRWSFKPEVGYMRRWGRWEINAYGAVWLFTRNSEFFSPTGSGSDPPTQTQKPVVAFETHVMHDVRPRLWVSFDANFWYGGQTSLDGVESPATVQRNSRVGITASLPLARRQSVKVGYADGAYVRFGGDYAILSAAWQYSWLGKGRRGAPSQAEVR